MPSSREPNASTELYVVIDTSGAGRVVGIFDSALSAREVEAVNPPYYKAHRFELNTINPTCFGWLTRETARQRLLSVIRQRQLGVPVPIASTACE